MMMLNGGAREWKAGDIAFAVLVLTVGIAVSGCDKSPLLAPTESTVTLTTSAATIPSGGSATLNAVVIESAGTAAQNGTTVRFSSNIGRVQPIEAQTRNGVATTTFFADGASGVAQVTAVSGAATAGSGTNATNSVTITIGTAAVDTVSVQAAPSSVPVSGGTVAVTASVVGANNSALAGVPVSFSTTAGTLSSTVATTDASGNATVQLTTNREATVTASVGSKSGTTKVTVAAQATVTLTATAGAAGTPTSVTVTPATGTAPNVVINWGDGATLNLGLVATPRTVIHVYDQPGTYTVTADASEGGDTVSTSTVVAVAPRAAPTLTVSPTTGTPATTFVFTITPATTGGVRDVQIDFGDGSSQDLGPITAVTTASHRFSSAGNYAVRVTQTDFSGGASASVVVVSVIAGP
jgi:hypothetical protein